jgi:transcriptional regulator NrdR family protein
MYDNLTDEIKALADDYAEDPSVQNLRKLQHAHHLLASELLMQKAVAGSTAAVIEYAKMYRAVPTVDDYEDVAQLANVTKDDLQVAVAQVQMKMRANHFKEITVESVTEAYRQNHISYREQQDMIQLLERNKKASDDHVSSDINVYLDVASDDAL